jgi:hypothetical protein
MKVYHIELNLDPKGASQKFSCLAKSLTKEDIREGMLAQDINPQLRAHILDFLTLWPGEDGTRGYYKIEVDCCGILMGIVQIQKYELPGVIVSPAAPAVEEDSLAVSEMT